MKKYIEVVINSDFGGFSLSSEAYEKLIEWGVPVRKYISEVRESDGLYKKVPENEGEVIFDNELGDDSLYHQYKGKSKMANRYWDTWTRENRTHPLVVRVVKELGEKASGFCASLKIVNVPIGVEWEIDDYDGREHIAEKHRTWA